MQLVSFDACQVREDEDDAIRLSAQHVVYPRRIRVLLVASFGGDDA